MFLRELRTPVTELKGAGPAVAAKLARLGIYGAADLLLHAPRDYEDRSRDVPLAAFAAGPVNCLVEVMAHDWFGFGRNRTLKLWIEDDAGTRAALVCFNRPFMERSFPVGTRVRVFGRFEYRYGDLQSAAFELEHVGTDGSPPAGVLALYPATEGLAQGQIRTLVRRALATWGRVDDELPPDIRERRGLLRKADALRCLHVPATPQEAADALRTLSYEELFYLQVMIGRRALERRRVPVERVAVSNRLADQLEARLPFELTADQKTAIAEIVADMTGPWPMARLLQGDVGSGKTLVAFMAALYVIAGGGQVAMLAPTELLARQHAENAARLLEPLGVRLAFLSGNVADSARKPLLSALERGEVDFILGTHALFSDDVAYHDLRFVIVDEQQRFGVLQRLAMGSKGRRPDVLMTTATPIPRTLALTAYGDLTVSTIRTMPPGREPVATHLAKQGNEQRVYDFVRRELEAGRRAYFVYPLVDSSERLDLKDAEAMYERLAREVYPEFKGGLVHSRLPEETKRAAMHDFAAGKLSFLVATSVVEVGVDVPEATCMVIEHAERFGLAALHQLRGRVGRGRWKSYCFLVWSDGLGEDGKRRLKAMLESNDGFVIAEEDLRIRGPGQITGTAQAGALRLAFADPVRDAALLEAAREDAKGLLDEDPGLVGPRGVLVRSVIERASPFAERTAATG